MDIRVGRLASLPDFVRWLGRLLQTQIDDVNPSSSKEDTLFNKNNSHDE